MSSINIDGKDYLVADLSDEVKALLASIQYVDKSMDDAKQKLAALQTARNSYGQDLKAALPK